mmetsp:Transcript_51797/g.121617  ORF Transcript_51797/g.121617 Transcript_51797/m.121617 type:complete len:287 (+) Transcript_51797:72-932(+)
MLSDARRLTLDLLDSRCRYTLAFKLRLHAASVTLRPCVSLAGMRLDKRVGVADHVGRPFDAQKDLVQRRATLHHLLAGSEELLGVSGGEGSRRLHSCQVEEFGRLRRDAFDLHEVSDLAELDHGVLRDRCALGDSLSALGLHLLQELVRRAYSMLAQGGSVLRTNTFDVFDWRRRLGCRIISVPGLGAYFRVELPLDGKLELTLLLVLLELNLVLYLGCTRQQDVILLPRCICDRNHLAPLLFQHCRKSLQILNKVNIFHRDCDLLLHQQQILLRSAHPLLSEDNG